MIKVVVAASLMVVTASAASAIVTITIEAPGVQHTTQLVNGPALVTFDAMPIGVNTGITLTASGTTATIDSVNVLAADLYGGAGGAGRYAAVRKGHTTTVSFSGAGASYVGFYASAIDSGSSVTACNGTTVLYTHSLPFIQLAAGDFGNPDRPFVGRNARQGYAFFNINSSTAITSFVFTQANTFGAFEFDNLTIGSVSNATVGTVPEPASWALMLAGFAMVGFSMRRRTTYTVA